MASRAAESTRIGSRRIASESTASAFVRSPDKFEIRPLETKLRNYPVGLLLGSRTDSVGIHHEPGGDNRGFAPVHVSQIANEEIRIMLSFENTKISRRTLLRGIGASLALPFMTATASRGVCQLDPDDREYVFNVFEIEHEKIEVLVAKTGFDRYVAGKEYWSAHQNALHRFAIATPGTMMTILGTSHNWPGPRNFKPTFRMQDAVTWGTSTAPAGNSWVYRDVRTNTFVCIEFNITRMGGRYHVTSMKWHLAAQQAPLAGTYVFAYGPKYTLSYTMAPTLPTGYSWYGVTVNPGS